MLTATIGHTSTVDYVSPSPGAPPRMVVLSGVFETTWQFPPDFTVRDAFVAVVASVPSHVDASESSKAWVSWVETNDPNLTAAIVAHYGVRQTSRPVSWSAIKESSK